MGAVPGPVILDNLIASSKIPSTIAVFVSNRSIGTREEDLLLGPIRGETGLETFLSKDLVPWLHQRYKISSDPKQNVLAGASAGGFAATYAAFRLPRLFGNILSHSGAFYFSPVSHVRWRA
jgi:enterochelin esterase family protein